MLKFKINYSKSEDLDNGSTSSSSRLSQISTYSSDELKSEMSVVSSLNPSERYFDNSSTEQHRTIISINDENSMHNISKSSTSSNYSMGNSQRMGVRNGIRLSTSLSSLSSIDSGEGISDVGYLRVFTGAIKADTDYTTLKVNNQTTSQIVVEMILSKFRISFRDINLLSYQDRNLFQLWMEVRTRHNGQEVKSILELDKNARPLELQRCHPVNMSRFILSMVSNAIPARFYINQIHPQANYKSVLITRRTTCHEALELLLQLCRIKDPKKRDADTISLKNRKTLKIKNNPDFSGKFCFFVVENGTSPTQLQPDCLIAGVYLSLMPNQRIELRHIDGD